MVSFSSADGAIGVDMFMSPALVALALEGALGFNEVVLPTILTGTFELLGRGRRGVSPSGRAPAIISGALGGDKGDS